MTPRSSLVFRRGRPPADESVVEAAPELGLRTDADRDRLEQAFADLYADVLLDALARQERGADPIAAVHGALAAAEAALETRLPGAPECPA